MLLNAFAIAPLTLLGAAGESLGFDRLSKAYTVKRRTHSLFRQGSMLHDFIPTMPGSRLMPLMQRFGELLLQQPYSITSLDWYNAAKNEGILEPEAPFFWPFLRRQAWSCIGVVMYCRLGKVV